MDLPENFSKQRNIQLLWKIEIHSTTKKRHTISTLWMFNFLQFWSAEAHSCLLIVPVGYYTRIELFSKNTQVPWSRGQLFESWVSANPGLKLPTSALGPVVQKQVNSGFTKIQSIFPKCLFVNLKIFFHKSCLDRSKFPFLKF